MQVLVDGHQLDGGHAQATQVVEEHGMGEAAVRAPQPRLDPLVPVGRPLHVQLQDDAVRERGPRWTIVGPVEERVGDDRPRREGRVSVVSLPVGPAAILPEERRVPGQVAVDGPGVRIEEELGGVAAPPPGRVPRSVDAVAVTLPGPHAGQIRVPGQCGPFGQPDPLLPTAVIARGPVEQAQIHPVATPENSEKLVPAPS